MKKLKIVFSILLSLGMIAIGVWLGYQGTYFRIAGTKTPATVVASRGSVQSADDVYYIFHDQDGTLRSGSDRVFGLEVPSIEESIEIYSLSDGRSTYVTPIDDYVLPLGALIFGMLALRGTYIL